MQASVKTKRKYFTNLEKRKILSQLESGDMTHSELARKHGIHPITIYTWKRNMGQEKKTNQPEYDEILEENLELKKQLDALKKALADIAVEKQILQTANDVLKKIQRQKQSKSQKKSSKK